MTTPTDRGERARPSTPSVREGENAAMAERMRCARCGDVIGFYEPLVYSSGQSRSTSAAAEPQIGSEPGERFHRGCYLEPPDSGAPST